MRFYKNTFWPWLIVRNLSIGIGVGMNQQRTTDRQTSREADKQMYSQADGQGEETNRADNERTRWLNSI